MTYKHYYIAERGFAGYLIRPGCDTERAVIVIMGGKKGLLPGTMIAERFADFGFAGLSVR